MFKNNEIIPLISLLINVSLVLALVEGTYILKYGLIGDNSGLNLYESKKDSKTDF